VRAVISFVVVAVTVVFQLTIVARIAFPGGAGPDLVLLVVAALALAGGPMAGVLTGFLAGLALDVAPPGSHFVGQNALVFCLVGYLCGLLADVSGDPEQGHTALFEIAVTAAGSHGHRYRDAEPAGQRVPVRLRHRHQPRGSARLVVWPGRWSLRCARSSPSSWSRSRSSSS